MATDDSELDPDRRMIISPASLHLHRQAAHGRSHRCAAIPGRAGVVLLLIRANAQKGPGALRLPANSNPP